jgi:hypothetical protein
MEWRYLRAELEKEQVIMSHLLANRLYANVGIHLNMYRETSHSNKEDMRRQSNGIGLHTKLSQRCLIINLISLLLI